MRLDRFIANNTGLPRKEACLLIKQGRITCNNAVIQQTAFKVGADDLVELDGNTIKDPTHLYWMMNKAQGIVCANHDSEHPTVFDSIDKTAIHPALRQNLQVAGRLDKDTTGLVLITTDGQWNHTVTSPHKTIGKCYRVELAESITEEAILQIEAGIALRNEPQACKPAQISLLSPNSCLLTIHEGKYHQVKRMFAATNNRVVKLHREAIANIKLDTSLKPNAYRALTQDEIHCL